MVKANDVQKKILKESPRSIYDGDTILDLVTPRFSFGSFLLDVLTAGGVPEGKFTQFHGAESSGKSTMALRVVGEFLKKFKDKTAVFLDFEKSVEWPWAQRFIHDRKRLKIPRPRYGEEGIDWAGEFAAAEDVGLIVVDSIGGMFAMKDATNSADQDTMGLQARITNKLLRKLTLAMSDADRDDRSLTVLLINQLRSKVGGMPSFGEQTEKPGGRMLKHLLHLDLQFWGRGFETFGSKTAGTITPFASKHQVQVKKNKLGVPQRAGSFHTYLVEKDGFTPGEIPESQTVFDLARKVEVVKRAGNKWQYGKKTWGNMAVAINAFHDDPALRAKVAAETLAAATDNLVQAVGDE